MSYGAVPDLSSTAQLWCRSGPGFTARCECVRHAEADRTKQSRQYCESTSNASYDGLHPSDRENLRSLVEPVGRS